MALMIPDEPPGEGPGAKAERALWSALREGLSDEFFVYHRLPYVDRKRAAEGEADFVVLHRRLGLLVIECKGYGVRRDGTGRWVRVDALGQATPLRESPFAQVQRTTHELLGELRRRLAEALPALADPFPLSFGHAVAFPFTRVGDAPLPLEVDRRMLLGAEDLDELGPRVEAAMAFWRAQRSARGLEVGELKRFRRDVLHPAVELVSQVGARLQADDRALVRLSEEQADTLRCLLGSRRLGVMGGAGTGKTVVAVEAARTLAAQGKQVLLLCFNNALARHLSALVEDHGAAGGSVTARSFHQLCRSGFHALGEEPAYPEVGTGADEQFFWNVEMATGLLRALEAGALPRWDAVVVDEGQDFEGDWWPLVEDCLRDRERGTLAVFHDPAQSIFGRTDTVPDFPAKASLDINFRNTRRILEVVRALGGPALRPHARSPEGEPVAVYAAEGPAKTVRLVESLVRRLVTQEGVRPEQIALLSPHSRKNCLLQGLTELAGLPLCDDPLDREGALLLTSFGRFKGLEADVVILLDADPDHPRCGRKERYVAASRARLLLHVFARGDWLR